MPKLYFKYGTMNSGKSFHLQTIAHNYEETGRRVYVIKPQLDTRDDEIISRTGFKRKPNLIVTSDTSIYAEVFHSHNHEGGVDCVLVDEAQFLTKGNVMDLVAIVDDLGIPVMAFGLKNDFKNELFEGSYHLLVQAESIEEIKTICWYCNKKATMVVRFEDGVPVYQGEQIVIDTEENRTKNTFYRPSCRSCYKVAERYERGN